MLGGEGASLMLGTVALGVLLFALALKMRSWALWLLAFTVLVAAIGMAWVSRAGSLVEVPPA
jgi:hypothetical protein